MEILTNGIKFVFNNAPQIPIYLDFGVSLEEIRSLLDTHMVTFAAQDYYLDQVSELMHRTLVHYGPKN
jgi:hypothetical protein